MVGVEGIVLANGDPAATGSAPVAADAFARAAGLGAAFFAPVAGAFPAAAFTAAGFLLAATRTAVAEAFLLFTSTTGSFVASNESKVSKL